MLREIKGTQRLPRMLAFLIDGITPAAKLDAGAESDAVITDNGVGDYTLTFKKPFARKPVVVKTPETAQTILRMSVVSATQVRVLAFATDGTTPKDAYIHAIVFGWDSADKY